MNSNDGKDIWKRAMANAEQQQIKQINQKHKAKLLISQKMNPHMLWSRRATMLPPWLETLREQMQATMPDITLTYMLKKDMSKHRRVFK
eukprot:16443737-Heterocapsa_arctica.AAC.1